MPSWWNSKAVTVMLLVAALAAAWHIVRYARKGSWIFSAAS